MARRQCLDRAQQRTLAVVAVRMGQERDHGLVVGGGVEAGEREKRLDLRREDKGAGRHAVIEGLDPQAIPRGKQASALRIPNGQVELPVEPGETIRSSMVEGL